MPVSTDNIISEEKLTKWPYLKELKIALINSDVDLLYDTNASKLMEPWEMVQPRRRALRHQNLTGVGNKWFSTQIW